MNTRGSTHILAIAADLSDARAWSLGHTVLIGQTSKSVQAATSSARHAPVSLSAL